MKTLLFEGISSSGKTTIIHNIQRYAHSHDLTSMLLEEQRTIMPMIDNEIVENALLYLSSITTEISQTDVDLVLIDRFHVSHSFKTTHDLSAFKQIEQKLKDINTTIVMLKIDEDRLYDRIKDSSRYKEQGWIDYMLRTNGRSFDKVVDFLLNRQRIIEQRINESCLNFKILDISGYDFVTPTRCLIDEYL